MTCRLTTTTALALCLALPAAAESFDLDALIAAARTEAPITIYDSTSKIIEMADRFTQTYGIAVTGVKVRSPDQAEMVSREARAGNIQGDVVHLSDVPSGLLELIPQGYLESWLPPDLASDIPAGFQDPLVLVTSGKVFVHNTETHDSCPIDTIWDLTRPEWSGRFAMQDPLNTGELTDLFNQMETHADAEVAAAYEKEFGTPLNADGTATRAFVQALAANDPLLTENDQSVGDAVGAPGQSDGFLGLVSTAKFRDNESKGYTLGLCSDVAPMIGFTSPNLALIATGTESPNLARLWVRYVMTEDGIAPQAADGKISGNRSISLPDDEPSGVGAVLDRLFNFRPATAADDLDMRQDWQDIWRIAYSRN